MDNYKEEQYQDNKGIEIPSCYFELEYWTGKIFEKFTPIPEEVQIKWFNEWDTNTRYNKYYKNPYNFLSKMIDREGSRKICEFWDEKNQTDTETYVFNALVKKFKTPPIVQQPFYCTNGNSYPYEIDLLYSFENFNVKSYLAIEIDGDHNVERDKKRDQQLLNEFNVHTIRFTNMDVYKSKRKDGLELTSLCIEIDNFLTKHMSNMINWPPNNSIH